MASGRRSPDDRRGPDRRARGPVLGLVPAARADDIGIVEQVTEIRFPAAWNVLEELWSGGRGRSGGRHPAAAIALSGRSSRGEVGSGVVRRSRFGAGGGGGRRPARSRPPVGARGRTGGSRRVLSATSRDGVRQSWPLMVGQFVEIAVERWFGRVRHRAGDRPGHAGDLDVPRGPRAFRGPGDASARATRGTAAAGRRTSVGPRGGALGARGTPAGFGGRGSRPGR